MSVNKIIFILMGSLLSLYGNSQQNIPGRELKFSRDEIRIKLNKSIEKQMHKSKITGLSLAVVDREGVLIANGFGMADKERSIPANESTLFPIASITKTFTGIAVMQLVEQGLLDPDRPIGDYIPELSLPGHEERMITTRMLLTHHSGIHGDILYNWYLPEVSADPLIFEQVIPLVNQAGTIFTPGTMHSYCNAGYSLLGVLIHRISGTGYVDYIRTHIFKPLGMNQSIVYAGEKTDGIISRGYNGKKSVSMPLKLGIPAGGIALSALDAATYMQGVINSYNGLSQLLKQKTMKQMMTCQNAGNAYDKGFSMGLSWFLQDPLMEKTLYAAHRGELPPFHSQMIILPETGLGVFISLNTNSAADVPQELAHRIIYDLYEYYSSEKVPPVNAGKSVSVGKEVLKTYQGMYPNVYFGPMEVKFNGKKLLIKTPSMPLSLVLVPLSDSCFALKACIPGLNIPVKQLDALRVEFRETEGKKYMYFNIQNRMLNPNVRLEPFHIPEEYKNYVGAYKVVNMENSDRVVRDVKIKYDKRNELLNFRYTFLGRHKLNMILQPAGTGRAIFAGTGYFTGEKLRWETSGNQVFLYWSGLKLAKE